MQRLAPKNISERSANVAKYWYELFREHKHGREQRRG